jgi:hypothetical protein
MDTVISEPERELAKDIADRAMVAGWETAIRHFASELAVDELRIRKLLNDALDYNDKADPAGRIGELEDWRQYKQRQSDLPPRRPGDTPPKNPTRDSSSKRGALSSSQPKSQDAARA